MKINYFGDLTPGVFVINENKEDEWGLGQVQSSIDDKVTIILLDFGMISIFDDTKYELFKKVFDLLIIPNVNKFFAGLYLSIGESPLLNIVLSS